MKSDVVCRPFTFRASVKSQSSLMNRYKLGRILNGRLILDPYECSFLLITGKITPEGPKSPEQIIQYFENDENFSYLFTVYFALKKAGFYARVSGGEILVRKKPSDVPVSVKAVRDDQNADFCSEEYVQEHISAVVDMDGDITIFGVIPTEIHGTSATSGSIFPSITSGNRMFRDSEEFPLWFGYSRGKVKFLSEIEYLAAGGESPAYYRSERLRVYTDLLRKGFILKSGFKYGADFRAYMSLESEHAEYLINSVESPMEWSRLSRLVRVANAVRKTAILACTGDGGIKYLRIRRIKDFNSLYSDQIWASKSSTVGLNSE